MAPNTYLGASLPSCAGLDHLRAGHAFRKRQAAFHAQRPAQQDDEEDADQPAHQQNRHGLPIVRPQVGPQVFPVDFHHHERGDGEDGAGDQRFPHRGRRARDVLLQNPAAPDAEHGDGDDGGRNGGRDGLSRLHAQVGVSRAEDQRQQKPQPHRFEGHFGWIGGMLRVRHKGGWYHAPAWASFVLELAPYRQNFQ